MADQEKNTTNGIATPFERRGSRLFRLKSLDERKALQRLSSMVKKKREFERSVRSRLAEIEQLAKPSSRDKRGNPTQELRGQIKTLQKAIELIRSVETKPLQSSGLIPRLIPCSDLNEAVRCLQCHKEVFEADLRAMTSRRRPFRHNVSPLGWAIVELVELVRQITRQPHWEDLAILLRSATGDQGLTATRLSQRYRDRRSKFSAFRRAALHVELNSLR